MMPRTDRIGAERRQIRARVARLVAEAQAHHWAPARFISAVRFEIPEVGTHARRMWNEELGAAGYPLSAVPDHRQLELFAERGAA